MSNNVVAHSLKTTQTEPEQFNLNPKEFAGNCLYKKILSTAALNISYNSVITLQMH